MRRDDEKLPIVFGAMETAAVRRQPSTFVTNCVRLPETAQARLPAGLLYL